MHASLGFLGLAALAQASAVEKERPSAKNTYEYIVVGSGPGGGGLASNLARAGHSVLLIEAGEEEFNNTNSQYIYTSSLAVNDPKTRWDFFVTRDTPEVDGQNEFLTWRLADGSFYTGLDPPEGAEQLGIYYPRAGTVGGCAMHNAGSISLPADVDWNDIAAMTGDKSWQAPNMRRHLVHLEHNLYLPNGSTPDHGFNGYIDTSQDDVTWANQGTDLATISQALSDKIGGAETGLSLYEQLRRDLNHNEPGRDQQDGVFGGLSHSNNGLRSSPRQYIRATLDDPRKFPLTLQTQTLVTKVLFSKTKKPGAQPKAIGVEYLKGASMYAADPRYDPSVKGTVGQAFATRDVIISGGTFNTPQILKLSGIGPREELEQFDIPVVKDAPGVGINLKDNLEAALYGTFEKPIDGFFDIMYTTKSAERTRDIHAFCGSMWFLGFFPGMPGNLAKENQFMCGIMQLHPRNVNGSVKLRSANPRDVPAIDLGFFGNGNDEDLESLLETVNLLRPAFNSVSNNTFTEFHPCAPGDDCNDDFQRTFIRKQAHGHHAAGTAAMGPKNDPFAVVDSHFRVWGVSNLRVVDASVYPVMPGELPVLPTLMLSEKATSVILGELGEKY
ncbi:alcohol dehydrogenase [Diaporthe helianthi]|uniref:Alcohol dehydrogenase n=1 Tax=Diaporthe helianthi TaxID=158607 RepID=A0A2P5HT37_DIAHE|nr:alcohol dehydrogenase [Diaporthe helianthi]